MASEDMYKLSTFYRFFYDNSDELLKVLFELKLLKKNITCPTCKRTLQLNKRLQFRCRRKYNLGTEKKQCEVRIPMVSNTFFERSRLSITKIVEFVCLWATIRVPRIETIKHEMDISQPTITDWSSNCREVCLDWALKRSQQLGGQGSIVEIDEAKFGKRKYNRGRKIEGQWVFGGVERGTKKSFFVPVEDRTAETLLGVIKKYVLPNTTIMSDLWKAYDCLNNEGFTHYTVNHSIEFVSSTNSSIHTQNIERTWRNLKETVPKCGMRKSMFAGYLAESQFKMTHHGKERLKEFWEATASLYPGRP